MRIRILWSWWIVVKNKKMKNIVQVGRSIDVILNAAKSDLDP